MHTHTTPTQRDGSNFTSTIIVAASASIGAIFIIVTGMKRQHKERHSRSTVVKIVGITKVGNQMPSQQKTNYKQLGYCSCVTILPMLIQRMWPICYL